MPEINFYPQEVMALVTAAEKDGFAPVEWMGQEIVKGLSNLGWLTATHENDDGTTTYKITDEGRAAYALWRLGLNYIALEIDHAS